jgi:putative ABC transport system substrate-binding protein
MKRREFIALVGGAAGAWPLTLHAQKTPIPVVGYLSESSPESDLARITGLRRGLSEAGYVEGRTVTIEYRWAANQVDQLPVLAAVLVEHRVAVIVTPGTPATLAAKAATSTIPIVFVVGNDPAELGLVANLNRPGGNLTGFNVFRRELAAKRIDMLHELLPGTMSVGLLEDPNLSPDGLPSGTHS